MTTYYVDWTGGNDGNTGLSPVQAWKTTDKVTVEIGLGTFTGGDEILFKRGETWTVTGAASCVRFAGSSGSIGNHIYVGPYGVGARPRFVETVWFWKGMFFRDLGDAAANYWTVEGLEFTSQLGGGAIWIDNAHHYILRDLYIHDTMINANWKCGIKIAADAEYVWIENCTITNIDGGEGIYGGTAYDVNDRTRRVVVKDCTITSCENEGLDTKDGCVEWFIYDNQFENTGTGVDFAHMALGGRHHHVYNCRLSGTVDNHKVGVYMSQYTYEGYDSCCNEVERCLFIDETGSYGGVRIAHNDNRVVNNTFVDGSYGIYGAASSTGGNVIRNNIFEGMSSYEVYLTDAHTRYDFDYDDYGDGGVQIWYESGAGRDLAYVQGLGHELNCNTNDPDFADAVDYNLNATSTLIDDGEAAATVYDWNDEYAGTGSVDMGWMEYNWTRPHRTFKSLIEDAVFSRFTGSTGIVADANTVYVSPYSLRVTIPDLANRYAYRTGLGDIYHFYADFEIKVDDLTMAGGDLFNIWEGHTSGGVALVVVQLQYSAPNIQIRAGIIDDTNAWSYTGWFNVPSDWNHVQFYWAAAPDTSYNEGELVLWLNEVEEAHVSGVNNHDRTVDRFYIGAVSGLDAGTGGAVYFDVVRLDHIRCMDEYPYGPPPPPYEGATPSGALQVAPFFFVATYETLGLSIHESDPLIKPGRSAYLGELRPEANSYEQEVAALGGYYSARFDLAGSMVDVNEWFERGLGRHIETYNPDMEIVWEGFVNQVSVNAGQYAATRGPLVEVANRVYVIYSERDTSTDPPTVIPGMITVIAEDADSQARWGIWEKAVSGGETDAAGAQYYRDVFLAENAEPFTDDPRVVAEAGGQISVSVECLGYWAWLLAYPYQDLVSGTVTCTTKVQSVLQADTNGIFSVDYSQIGSNLALAPRYEDSGTPAWNVMKALVAQGDINDDRWTFGVYEGRRVRYQKMPTREVYQHRLADPSQRVETIIGGQLAPWDVSPGQWLYLPDFLTGRGQPERASDKRKDPRFVFIESVRYRAPYAVEMTGTRVGRLAQIQAKLGLGGT